MYQHPGVYIEHVPSGVLAIEAASTSVAAFIGPVKRGPVGEPVFVSSQSQFATQFGELDGQAGGIRNEGAAADMFGHAIQAFFANGGARAYIVRVAEDGETPATDLASAQTSLPNPEDPARGFTVTAVNPGTWANVMVVRLSPTDPAATPDLELGYTFEVGIEEDGSFVALETFTGVEMASDAPRSIESVIGDESLLVNIEGAPLGTDPGEIPAVQANALLGGNVGSAPWNLADRGMVVTVDGTDVTVIFPARTSDLQSVADHIQATVRAGNPATPDFTVQIVSNGSNRQLLLISGILGTAGAVTVGAPAGPGSPPSAITGVLLNFLNANTTVTPFPTNDLSSGGLATAWMTGGSNGVEDPGLSVYQEVYTTLRDFRDISIMLLPGQAWIENGDNSIIQTAITHAEFMQNRMVIVDPPDTTAVGNRLNTPKDVKDLGVSTSPYVALYYPWLSVGNPYYDPDTAANLPKTFAIPPSAFAAGMWARIDGARGVWKAPAGLEATVRGAIGPNVLIGNDLQDNLNEFGVNCLRSIIGPTVIWGARTRATKTKPEFRYVPVRRTQNMIGESLYNALQAVVFEPNDHRLWASLRASAGNFMDTLHRAGAFQGEKASDAFYVQCGLGSTMTQADIDAGVVRLVVGFAPLKPAEFVVVQIRQIVGQTA